MSKGQKIRLNPPLPVTGTTGQPAIEELARIYEAYAPRVFRVAARTVGDYHAAEDITQDVFLRIHDRLGSFRGQSDLYTWIFRITVNLSINWVKHRAKSEARGNPNPSTASFDPAQDLIRKEKQEEVAALIEKLTPMYRTCLVLKDMEGLSYEQIAEVLEIPVGTATTRVARAREQFVRALKRRQS